MRNCAYGPGRLGKYLPRGGKTLLQFACAKAEQAFTVWTRNKRFRTGRPNDHGANDLHEWEKNK
jgi:hypothetical protein